MTYFNKSKVSFEPSNASDEIIPSQKRLYDIKVKVGDEVKLISRGKIDLLPDVTNTI